jgi:hypothetical protein
MRIKYLLRYLPVLISSALFSQGGHYWTEQYGTRSILMSGSVIGGVEDLGTVYYNPGRLALIENRAFLLSATLYQLEKLRILDAVDEGKDLTKKSFGGVPGLAAGTFSFPFLPKHHFSYAVLRRQRSDFNFFVRTEKEGIIVEQISGNQLFTGRLQVGSKYNEEWMLLSWSYPIRDNFSIGISNIYANMSSTKSIDMQLQLLYEDNARVGQMSRNRRVGVNQDGLLWKIGLAWKISGADLGLTLTTPKINLRGKGNFIYEDFLSGLPDSVGTGHFKSSLQDGLNAVHKSPFSLGAGATIKLFRKHLLHLSAEWFGSVPAYTMLEAEPFTGQSSGEKIFFSLMDQAESVINYGAGIEYKLIDEISFYASYSSDYSYVPSDIKYFTSFDDEAYNSTFRADINHAGAGLVLKFKRADISLGSTYAWAREVIPRPVDFPDEGSETEIFVSDETAELLWSRWRFIFSFSVPFLRDVQDNIEDRWSERKRKRKEVENE